MNDLIAIVGVGAILPDAPDASTFWTNIRAGRYSITDVPDDRWKAEFFYDPNPSAPDKTYSKIGGWVRGFKFEPMKMGIAIPPKSQVLIDEAQQWAIAASYQALQDYGYPQRRLDPERVAVVLGNAMAGESHYLSTIRIHLPEYLDILASLPSFQGLSPEMQAALMEGLTSGVRSRFPEICEDTMPGELANIIAGRVSNVFNFSGPNFVTDAACASSLAALQSAVNGLRFGQFDAALTGGVDRNMGPESFVKFSKIGALSPDGSRPYADGANGFVMGEGAAVFLLKRLADAERDGDKIYAVIRGIGGSSDGKGKGITAPNPIGQQRAVERAWKNAGLSPETVGLLEGHGTSTAVGDVVEMASLNAVFGATGLRPGSVALGSVKSNFGHLKSAAGAAGMLKAALALHARELPPSVNFERPNPKIDFAHSPFFVNTQTRPWEVKPGEARRAGVSAFGFGGANFHVVLEEYLPGALTGERIFPVPERSAEVRAPAPASTGGLPAAGGASLPLYHGLLFLGAESPDELRRLLIEKIAQAERGQLPPKVCPASEEIGKPERLVIDFEDGAELLARAAKALKALETDTDSAWQPLGLQGVYRGRGRPGKVAFLFPGQGSQYVNMLRDLRDLEPLVAETFREADATMTPILGRPLTSYIFADGDREALEKAELKLRDTVITQPAILTVNVALLRLMEKYGFRPDFVIGHSLGEYAALVAAGVLNLPEALQVVSARGQEMTRVTLADTGCMAAVSAPLGKVDAILATVPGYVVIANLNSPVQCVIGGETPAVEAAIQAFLAAGFQATKIPVSHAFHTRIVAPASRPLRKVIEKMNVQPPKLPIAANVTGDLYPTGREEILNLLADQVASPVQYVRGIERLYAEGARLFVEIGPKRVLSTLAVDILKGKSDVNVLSTNHPRKGGPLSFHEALCRLYAAGVTGTASAAAGARSAPASAAQVSPAQPVAAPEVVADGRLPLTGSVVISGAGLGLPGRGRRVFDDGNILSLLRGEMRIEPLPEETRRAMLEKRPVRLVKSEAGAVMQEIDDLDLTLKLAGQRGEFNPVEEFGIPQDRFEAIDISTQLAIAAGIEALRDAGIPLVMAYKRTTTGSFLPDRWKLPEALADETGVIFASAFPGLDRMAEDASRFYEDRSLRRQLEELRRMSALVSAQQADLKQAFEKRIAELEAEIGRLDYHLDRRYIFRVLAMGHSQFAEYIGARGPNTHVNAACATTTHAVSIAEDWIRAGRARRVVIVAGDDVTSGSLPQWIGTSLMASGAATTEGELRLAALPFDRRRNGMIIGMGAAALVVESEDAVRERGMRAICEVLASVTANSAFHGTRLDVEHIGQMMETLLQTAEQRFGISRSQIAPETVFISHETYTPARGGSAAAEIHALRRVFGEHANQVVITNTKGYTGHTMGVGIEDVAAVKALEHGLVPPIAHIEDGFEPDPALGDLNLSRGGEYPVQYSLRLGAGFGSQIAITLLRRIPGQGERVDKPAYQRWLADVAGYPAAELEIVQRTLRIRDQGAPARPPAKSRWQYGCGPVAWAAFPGQAHSVPAAPVSPFATVQASPAVEPTDNLSHEVPPSPAAGSEEIKAYLLAAVSEKTGYPPEVLDLNLDLEADLGIDTVKQAELFAAVREHYDIPRREDLLLSDYNTLAKVIDFVKESLGAAGGQIDSLSHEAPPFPAANEAQPAPGPEAEPEQPAILRRVPVPVLRPRLDLCIPTGVSLEEDARLLVVEGENKAGESLVRKLRARKVEVLRLKAGLAGEEIAEKVAAWQAEKPIRGVYFLPGLDAEPELDTMTPADWQSGLESRLYSLYAIMRALSEETFLVCATRLGGLHGYGAEGAAGLFGGAVSGFAKSLGRERPSAFVKVVDFETNAKTAEIASTLIEETLRDPGAVEIGRRDGLRYGVAVVEKLLPEEPNFELEPGSVFLISGGSGGIIRPIAEDLVSATRGTFYLLDRAPLPPADDPDLLRFSSDRQGLKKELFARLSQDGKKATPVQVEGALLALERAAATHQTMQIIAQKGGRAHYLVCDVTDPVKVGEAIQKIRAAEGRLDVFLHAAGLERSRKLESKPPEEFRLVVSVKADGFFNIYRALAEQKLLPRAFVFFSSVAGRFGNSGQADYSAANDLLCKAAASIRRTHPEIKTVAIDWSAWGGVGMATRGNIPMLMKMAGIDMLPPEQAAPRVRLELLAGGGEVVVAGSLGILSEPRSPNSGLDLALANDALRAGDLIHTMLSQVTGFDLNRGLVLEAALDPKEQPFLHDHAMHNVPILPGVMGIEGFSAVARHIGSALASDKGGLKIARLEDIQFLIPFKFYRSQPRRIIWKALAVHEAGGLVVHVTLESARALKTKTVEQTLHFSGKVYLQPEEMPLRETSLPVPQWNGKNTVRAEDIYKLYFHGPAFQVLEAVQRSGDTVLGKLNKNLPAITGNEHVLLSAPTLVELCFQTAGIWEIAKNSSLALPRSIQKLTLYRPRVNGAAIYAEVRPLEAEDGSLRFDARVLDADGRLYLELEGYRTTPLPYSAEKDLLDPFQELVK